MATAGEKFVAIIKAFRIRTLFLSLACVSAGGLLTVYYDLYNGTVFILTLITTIFLQILSNLANDYGDAVKGTDNENRVGPLRSVQSGAVSLSEMKLLTIIFAILSLITGLALIFLSIPGKMMFHILLFVVFGIGAIWAAIKYTVGKSAYGYSGFGDLFVFLFFGIVGVSGSFFLQALTIHPKIILVSIAFGFFSVGVLNLNNMRDVVNDSMFKKRTLVVRLGIRKAKYYHLAIIFSGWMSLLAFTTIGLCNWYNFTFVLLLPLYVNHIAKVFNKVEAELDPLLGQLSVLTFFLSIIFVVSQLI